MEPKEAWMRHSQVVPSRHWPDLPTFSKVVPTHTCRPNPWELRRASEVGSSKTMLRFHSEDWENQSMLIVMGESMRSGKRHVGFPNAGFINR